MFESSHPVAFFDYFRVPYRVVDAPVEVPAPGVPAGHPLTRTAALKVPRTGGATRLYWLPAAAGSAQGSPAGEWYVLGSIPVFGRVAGDDVVGEPLRAEGWEPLLGVRHGDGRHHASVWRRSDGSILLPFDPAELIGNLWSERYRMGGAGGVLSAALGVARRGYYRLRPLLPRSLQIRLRQRFTSVQRRSTFPAWPVEPALHDLYDLLFDLVTRIAGEQVPYVSLWPQGHTWAVVLTHDVETAAGYQHLHLLRDLESSLGWRSSWNFVPRRYDTDLRTVRDLQDAGFEVGVHGLYHDGRDLGSLRRFRRCLPAVHDVAREWGAVGFRSPALHRVWEWMPELAFEYDSSYPDTDPYQPVPGGCCSLLPYHNGQLVELPITLAQDFVMFDLLQQADEALWLDKVEHVRRRGGMALLLTHPDYMIPAGRRVAYQRFLTAIGGDTTAWRALPSEVAAWWRRRAASSLQEQDGSWRVVGPAAGEAQVAFAPPVPDPARA